MRRDTVENLARYLGPVSARHGLDPFTTAQHVLFGLRDPDALFTGRIADRICGIVRDIDDDNGGRDLHIHMDDGRRVWIDLITDEMCLVMIQRALAVDFAGSPDDLDVAARSAVSALSSPTAELAESFCSAASQVVETWDYRPLDKVTVSAERCCEEWNDLLTYLAR